MQTVRIIFPDPVALDGVSPIPQNSVVTQVPGLGLTLVQIPAGQPFGAFDPGVRIGPDQVPVLPGTTQAYWIKSLALILENGGSLGPNDFVQMLGPVVPGVTPDPQFPRRELQFDAQEQLQHGVVSEGLCEILPPDHRISFLTETEGPFVIQLTLVPPPTIRATCQPPLTNVFDPIQEPG